ncbi:cuticular protein RR-1 motif 11 precursor [Bombyx mori]|uniref:Putative cuticle protein n=1 Tax=Bombyx mori TaxID=7091 RepID=C0H6K2_BOMMO|nr:cuticular protein RR-1 motif 11 precursor [Bombyx mori]FAA00513.1 TPA: putative cuticle protein [Bombyx mori]
MRLSAYEHTVLILVLTALTAVCGAAKLDRTYLPPASAKTAGGSPGSLQTPLTGSFNQGIGELPAGGYTNDAQSVVVDAALTGTRSTGESEQSGLGGPRPSYGSTASKVGDAAFRGSQNNFGAPLSGQVNGAFEAKPERPQATQDRNSNIITYENNVDINNYNYGFETDNGIAVGENGVAHDGVHAQGGYSYKGDDGQVYSVTYTADKNGYKPQGNHLPTAPPIPDEILKSIEQNKKDEAAGLVDDGL